MITKQHNHSAADINLLVAAIAGLAENSTSEFASFSTTLRPFRGRTDEGEGGT